MRSAFSTLPRLGVGPKGPRGDKPAATGGVSGLDHHVVVLDRDRHGLGDVGAGDELRSRLHRDRVPARAHARRITPRLAGAHVEFPAMPGAADDLARPGIAVMARSIRFYQCRLLVV